MNIRLLAILLVFNWFTLYAEGTKELRPLEILNASIHLSKKAQFTKFGQFNALPEQQLKLRVNDLSETIYFGLNNHLQGGGFQGTLPYRIKSPSGIIVKQGLVPKAGDEGFITNWSEAVAGPKELGNVVGYDAIEVVPTEIGDYVIEFDMSVFGSNDEIDLHLFDFTIAKPDLIAIPGRLHSQSWQLTSEGGSNPFSTKVYPYGINGVVYEVEFDAMKPFTFVINFNATGAGNTGVFTEDRKSKIGNKSFPQFEVFLNPPDENVYPTLEKKVKFESIVQKDDCLNPEFCINFSSETEGLLEGFIDVDGNDVLNAAAGDVVFSQTFAAADTICIPWDGKDAFGNFVAKNKIKVVSSFGYGVMHLPLYDVEDNPNGFQVRVLRPSGVDAPKIFWDDMNITKGSTLGSPKTDLTGCDATASGCHLWSGRGVGGSEETINTWWFLSLKQDTIEFNPKRNSPVKLSYKATNLDHHDTLLCVNDQIQFFVFQDQISHFDTAAYLYNWYLNGVLFKKDTSNIRFTVTKDTEVVIESISKFAANCNLFDTLQVKAQSKYKADLRLTHPTCVVKGKIVSTLTQGASNPVFTWAGFPTEKKDSLLNIDANTYTLNVAHAQLSSNCDFDTTVTLLPPTPVTITDIQTTKSLCYKKTGTAKVIASPASFLKYSIDNVAFATSFTWDSLQAKTYTAFVRDTVSGCVASKNFDILDLPFTGKAKSVDATCGLSNGKLQLSLPDTLFTITWAGVSGKDTIAKDLAPSIYTIHVEATLNPLCVYDTSVTIQAIPFLKLDSVQTTLSLCYKNTGSVKVFATNAQTVKYSWNKNPFTTKTQLDSLPKGTYKVFALDTVYACKDSLEYTIDDVPFTGKVSSKDASCGLSDGKLMIALPDTLFAISWGGTTSKDSVLNNIPMGTYAVHVEALSNSTCVYDTLISVDQQAADIKINSLTTTASQCDKASGTASVLVQSIPGKTFQYKWDNLGVSLSASVGQLAAGEHKLTVLQVGSVCKYDTSFQIGAFGFSLSRDSVPPICESGTGEIEVKVSNPIVSILWNDGETSFRRENLLSGIYSYTLSVASMPSCSETHTLNLPKNTIPLEVDFVFQSEKEARDTYYVHESLFFESLNTDTTHQYLWSFGNGEQAKESSVENYYKDQGDFEVILEIKDQLGCVGQISKTVHIIFNPPCEAVMPNGFSPNQDGINDALKVLGEYEKIDLKVFNRWGEIIFRGLSMNDKWDGTFRGEAVPEGIYPYILDVYCPANDGGLQHTNEVGDITLVR